MKDARIVSFVLNAHHPHTGCAERGTDARIRLCEVVRDSYLQIIRVLRTVAGENGRAGITLSVPPTLLALLSEDNFRQDFEHFMDNSVKNLTADLRYLAETGSREKLRTAEYWLKRYEQIAFLFSDIGGDIVSELSRLEGGCLELITTTATNVCLPLLGNEKCMKAQIMAGACAFGEYFAHEPRGIWISGTAHGCNKRREGHPADAKFPRKTVEDAVASAGLDYFITDANADGNTSENGLDGTAFFTGNSGYAVPADVYNGGYVMDPDYLDTGAKSIPGGVRYWHRTVDSAATEGEKQYSPDIADTKAGQHASDFLGKIAGIPSSPEGIFATVVMSAELFGHLWYEGPDWIRQVYGKMSSFGISCETVRERMRAGGSTKTINLNVLLCVPDSGDDDSSCGSASGIWKSIHEDENGYVALLRSTELKKSELRERVLKQMGRELLLTEGSAPVHEGCYRISGNDAVLPDMIHSGHFRRLMDIAAGNGISQADTAFVESCEREHSAFRKLETSFWD